MRITRLVATLVALLFAALPVTRAQQTPAGGAPPRGQAPATAPAKSAGATGTGPFTNGIAVIDVTYILENYTKLKRDREQYNRDLEEAEGKFKSERDGMAKKAEQLKRLKPNNPDFKKIEEEIIQQESDWKLRVARQKAAFGEREAKNYLTAYQDITHQVKTFADRNGITLVLRFNGAPVDVNNREAVQADVLKMLMYHDPRIDITDIILKELDRSGAVATPPRGPQRPPAR